MADFLDDMLNGMAKRPPSVFTAHEKEMQKRAKDEKRRLQAFRAKATKALQDFSQQEKHKWMRYPELPPDFRMIIHSMAEEFGLISHSFGLEDNKFTIIYLKGHEPSDEKLEDLKAKYRGEQPPSELRRMQEVEEKRLAEQLRKKQAYREAERAKMAEANVHEEPPPEEELIRVNVIKRDKRTVADLEREIQARKRRRLGESEEDDGGAASGKPSEGSASLSAVNVESDEQATTQEDGKEQATDAASGPKDGAGAASSEGASTSVSVGEKRKRDSS